MSDNERAERRRVWANEAEEEAAYEEWVKVRENPENLSYGVESVGVDNLAFYTPDPPQQEFEPPESWDGEENIFNVAVGVCYSYTCNFPCPPDVSYYPDKGAENVLLGINGSTGTRLVNVVLDPEEALALAKSLKGAAKKAYEHLAAHVWELEDQRRYLEAAGVIDTKS